MGHHKICTCIKNGRRCKGHVGPSGQKCGLTPVNGQHVVSSSNTQVYLHILGPRTLQVRMGQASPYIIQLDIYCPVNMETPMEHLKSGPPTNRGNLFQYLALGISNGAGLQGVTNGASVIAHSPSRDPPLHQAVALMEQLCSLTVLVGDQPHPPPSSRSTDGAAINFQRHTWCAVPPSDEGNASHQIPTNIIQQLGGMHAF